MSRRTHGHSRASAGATLTRAQVREVDRLAIEALGIPGVVLMENAGRNATAALLEHLRLHRGFEPGDIRATVLCGGGNNGGDGYVIARHLYNQGAAVNVLAFKAPDMLTGDAAINARICQRMGLAIETAAAAGAEEGGDEADAARQWVQTRTAGVNVVVDALLGTGFSGAVREPMASAIEALNRLDRADGAGAEGVTVMAVDVPSGLDCDAGTVANVAVRAALTVTFVAAKPGLSNAAARAWVGALRVVDIGAPPELIERARREAGANVAHRGQ